MSFIPEKTVKEEIKALFDYIDQELKQFYVMNKDGLIECVKNDKTSIVGTLTQLENRGMMIIEFYKIKKDNSEESVRKNLEYALGIGLSNVLCRERPDLLFAIFNEMKREKGETVIKKEYESQSSDEKVYFDTQRRLFILEQMAIKQIEILKKENNLSVEHIQKAFNLNNPAIIKKIKEEVPYRFVSKFNIITGFFGFFTGYFAGIVSTIRQGWILGEGGVKGFVMACVGFIAGLFLGFLRAKAGMEHSYKTGNFLTGAKCAYYQYTEKEGENSFEVQKAYFKAAKAENFKVFQEETEKNKKLETQAETVKPEEPKGSKIERKHPLETPGFNIEREKKHLGEIVEPDPTSSKGNQPHTSL